MAVGRHVETVHYSGADRQVIVGVPSGLPADQATPLLVVLHGLNETASYIEGTTGFDVFAQQTHAIVLYPQGLDDSWDAGTCCGSSAAHHVDDVGFLQQLLEDARASWHLDPSRIYLVGFSDGGMLAFDFECSHGSEVSALVTVSATDVDTSPDGATSLCRPTAYGNLLTINGDADDVVPIHGGYNSVVDSPMMAVTQAALDVTRDDCTTGAPVEDTSQVTITDGLGCKGGALRQILVKHLGHYWTTDAKHFGIDETAAAISWLADHPRMTS